MSLVRALYTALTPHTAQLNLDSDPQDPSVDELTQLVQQRVTALSSTSEQWCKSHPKWREFKQRVWSVHHPDEALPDDEDNEVIAMHHNAAAETNYLCPITRAVLVRPVRKYVADVCIYLSMSMYLYPYIPSHPSPILTTSLQRAVRTRVLARGHAAVLEGQQRGQALSSGG